MADDEDVLRDPLSVEDDEYEIVHQTALVGVRTVPSLDHARATARHLVEHGLGATVADLGEPAGYEVRVLPEEATRARAVLDTSESLAGATADAGTGEVRPVATAAAPVPGESAAAAGRMPVPWKKLLIIWVAAMILLPLVAGVGTYLLSR